MGVVVQVGVVFQVEVGVGEREEEEESDSKGVVSSMVAWQPVGGFDVDDDEKGENNSELVSLTYRPTDLT